MDIDKLEAGRELDVLIADKVMGKGEWSTIGGIYFGPPEGKAKAHAEHTAEVNRIPHYSTDIAAAWKIVEKLERDGIMLWHIGREDSMPNWRAEFGRNHQPALGRAEGNTLPLTICRAALKTQEIAHR